MIAGIFHQGSGLGNQLHRYVMTRVLAKDMNTHFGMENPNNFKGSSFMKLDMGQQITGIQHNYTEPRILHPDGSDIRDYDWNIKNIDNNTLIDGEFQGENYYKHRLGEIREWLSVSPLDIPENRCVINFRGGEYVYVKDLFLSHHYWDKAIEMMRDINPNMKFQVHTDDTETARSFFPDFEIIQDIGINWRSVRYAHYLILSNSSFAILPALLNENVKMIIAPKYWAGYNKCYWQLRQNNYKKFNFIHHNE